MHSYFGATFFLLQLNHLKANSPSISEHLNFDLYLFSWWNYLHVNLVCTQNRPFDQLFFMGEGTRFSQWKSQNQKKKNNLDHRIAGSVSVILTPRVGVQHIQKVVQNCCQSNGNRMYTVSCKASYVTPPSAFYAILNSFNAHYLKQFIENSNRAYFCQKGMFWSM